MVEGLDHDADARHGRLDELDLAFERGQRRRRLLAEYDRGRWIERERQRRDAGLASVAPRPRQNVDVPPVDSIEIADRNQRRRPRTVSTQRPFFCYVLGWRARAP
jgi:hypothetical protein